MQGETAKFTSEKMSENELLRIIFGHKRNAMTSE